MQYRTIPKNSDRISVLGFGAMRFPEVKRRIDRPIASALLKSAMEKGVNYFDTALPYHHGDSETFLGEFLTENACRDDIRLATKLPPWNVNRSEDMESILTAQLDKLKTDHIDYYLLHCLNKDNWARLVELGVLEFLERELRRGRILNAGFSFHGDKESFKEIVDGFDWTICQIQLNYMDAHTQAGLEGLAYAASKRLGVMPGGDEAASLTGVLTIDGDYTQQDANLTIKIKGQLLGDEYSSLNVTGDATIDSVLEIQLLGGYFPQAGEQYVILTADSIDGTFPVVSGLGWYDVAYNADNVTVTVLMSPGDLRWRRRCRPISDLATFARILRNAHRRNVSTGRHRRRRRC